jgi:hypothetical protein
LALTFDGLDGSPLGHRADTASRDAFMIYRPRGPTRAHAAGFFVEVAGGAGKRRIDLLAYLWQIGRTPAWI